MSISNFQQSIQSEWALLTVEDVAALLKVPRSWIYERTRRRGAERLPHIKLGRYLRFEEKALREFLEKRKTT